MLSPEYETISAAETRGKSVIPTWLRDGSCEVGASVARRHMANPSPRGAPHAQTATRSMRMTRSAAAPVIRDTPFVQMLTGNSCVRSAYGPFVTEGRLQSFNNAASGRRASARIPPRLCPSNERWRPVRRTRSAHDHSYSRIEFAQLAEGFSSVHLRHGEIKQDQSYLIPMCSIDVHSLPSIGGRKDREPQVA